MLFEEYVDLVALEIGFPKITPAVIADARKGLQFSCDSPKDRFDSELRVKTNAVRNAKPVAGSFPVMGAALLDLRLNFDTARK